MAMKTTRMAGASAIAFLLTASMVAAQAPASVRVRATITSVDGGTLTAKAHDGVEMLTVTYKDGEKKIIVPPSAEIITYKKASVADLKPGQKIFVFAAKRLPDGMLEAPNISFGDYGVWR